MSLADFEKRIAALHQSMEVDLQARVRVFEGADLETIRREAHKIRGGFPGRKKLTELAAGVEELAALGDEDGTRRAVQALVQEAERIAAKATPSRAPEAVVPSAASERRILVVDDDDAIRRMLVITLRSAGYAVDELDDGVGVSDLLSREHYDLLIVDAMMPGMGGIEVVLRLREQQHTADLPVVVLSAASADELGAEARDITWWHKPVPAKQLLASVAEILGVS